MWKAVVIPVSIGLEETGYAHQAVNGHRSITVTHHQHKNYDRIEVTPLDDGYVRYVGIGKRQPDLTPHPEAVAVAAALNAMQP